MEEIDDRTHLDVFGQVAKEYLTQRLVSCSLLMSHIHDRLFYLIISPSSFIDSRDGRRMPLELETWSMRTILRLSLAAQVGRLSRGSSLSFASTSRRTTIL
jgi:hypothetical protein